MLSDWLRSFDLGARQLIEAGIIAVLGTLLGIGVRFLLLRVTQASKGHVKAEITALLKGFAAISGWAIVLFALDKAVIHVDAWSSGEKFAAQFNQIVATVWLVVATIVAIRTINRVFAIKESQALSDDLTIRDRTAILKKIVIGIVVSFAFLVGIRLAGVDISPFLAGGAIGGVIIGLALQESLGNVFSGVFLNLDHSIRIGELVRLETGEEGTLENVGWRNTSIKLYDQTLLMVPNSVLSKMRIINLNRPSQNITANVDSSVAYDSDLTKVERVVLEVAQSVQDHLYPDNDLDPPHMRWRTFGAYSIDFRVFVPIRVASDLYHVRSELIKGIKGAFEEHGITIPFPTQVLVRNEG